MMRTYEYIPFPELRRQYRKERKHRKAALQLLKWSARAAAYGMIAGMMAAGLSVV